MVSVYCVIWICSVNEYLVIGPDVEKLSNNLKVLLWLQSSNIIPCFPFHLWVQHI